MTGSEPRGIVRVCAMTFSGYYSLEGPNQPNYLSDFVYELSAQSVEGGHPTIRSGRCTERR